MSLIKVAFNTLERHTSGIHHGRHGHDFEWIGHGSQGIWGESGGQMWRWPWTADVKDTPHDQYGEDGDSSPPRLIVKWTLLIRLKWGSQTQFSIARGECHAQVWSEISDGCRVTDGDTGANLIQQDDPYGSISLAGPNHFWSRRRRNSTDNLSRPVGESITGIDHTKVD